MTPDIISKLTEEINSGICTEPQVIYLLVGIRKILEQEDALEQYEHLKFHCDWALHSRLTGTFAQKILKQFNNAHLQFLESIPLSSLPQPLQNELTEISKLEYFREELSGFLEAYSLPNLTIGNPNNWTQFLRAYAGVIEDCRLITNSNTAPSASIESVSVKVELAAKVEHGHRYFKVSWIILAKDGKSSVIEVFNSYEE